MNFHAAALTELARASRLFVVATEPYDGDVAGLNEAFAVAIRLAPGDIAEAMRAAPWQSGRNYAVAGASSPEDSVVMTEARQVFACILASDQLSADEPYVVTTGEVVTTDGYVWKHLFTVPQAAANKFASDTHVPVQTFASPYQSSFDTAGLPGAAMTAPVVRALTAGLHPYAVSTPSGVVRGLLMPAGELEEFSRVYAAVEEAAATGTGAAATPSLASGQIDALAPSTLGSGYTGAVVTIFGDGEGAAYTPVVVDGSVMSYTKVSGGTGYTWATAVVSAGLVSGAAALIRSSRHDDYGRDSVLIGKTTSVITTGSTRLLNAVLAISDVAVSSAIVKGPTGTDGVEVDTTFTPISTLGVGGEFALGENMQINTRVQTG